jgi:hypothetical protein
LPPFISFSTSCPELNSAGLRHTDNEQFVGDSEVGITRRYSSESHGVAVHNSLLGNPTEVHHCSQHAGANVDFGDEGAVDGAFLGNLKQLRALRLG